MEAVTFCIVAAVLIFNSVYDIRFRQTNTISIYSAIVVVGIMKIRGLVETGNLLYGLLGAAAFAFLLICVHKLLNNGIGGGDFDIVYLIFVGSGMAGVIQSLIIGLFAAVLYSVITGKKAKDAIPLVPFITFGYLINLWGVLF